MPALVQGKFCVLTAANFSANAGQGSWISGTGAATMSEDLQREYEMRFAKNGRYRARVWSVPTREFFARWIPPDATVLDLGCGWGEFINQIAAARRYGMDLNPETRSKLNPEVTLLAQNCSERWALRDGQLDLVFTSNFFEHLPTKESLRATLREAFRCLKPGGRIICLGPNIKYLPGAIGTFGTTSCR